MELQQVRLVDHAVVSAVMHLRSTVLVKNQGRGSRYKLLSYNLQPRSSQAISRSSFLCSKIRYG